MTKHERADLERSVKVLTKIQQEGGCFIDHWGQSKRADDLARSGYLKRENVIRKAKVTADTTIDTYAPFFTITESGEQELRAYEKALNSK